MEEIIAMHFSIHAEVRRKGKQNRNLSAAAPRYRLRRPTLVMTMIVFVLTVLLFPKQSVDGANSNDDYYADVDDSVSQGNQDDGSSSNSAATDDANSGYFAANDDVSSASAGDNANANQNSAADDLYVANDDNTSYSSSNSGSDNSYQKEQKQYQNADDDVFHWNANIGFDGVSVMPLSCINYNSGHMIKFQLFDSTNSYQCHFSEISTFVVSISHYMRAYFNYQALLKGTDYKLPADAAYLNCVPLQVNGNSMSLYAKIGCMERETFTSTKLQLHVYTDQQCSQKYEDGQSPRKHATRGYELGNHRVASKVSFKPEFYSCLTCEPEQISKTFNKLNSNWYDDDYISSYGKQQSKNSNRQLVEASVVAPAQDVLSEKDDSGMQLVDSTPAASREVLQAYHDSFWAEYHAMRRNLADHNHYDVGNWNMCQRIYKYGLWCDEECRSLDFFRTDLWSASDVFLLAIMCTFLTAMMLLVVAKRLKAQQKARMYGDDPSMPGLPPFAMAIIFVVIMVAIIVLATLKFINETLVFAVVTCILLFIYMLKLTLFENRRPVLLAAPRHDMFDSNPLDDHLFD